EEAFASHERDLRERIRQLSADLVKSGARYRQLSAKTESVQKDLEKVRRELAGLRRRIAPLKRSLAVPLAVLRGQRRLKQAFRARRLSGILPASTNESPKAAPAESVVQTSGLLPEPTIDWRDILRARFDAWLRIARAAEGDEVIVMFSG